jgi:hypothetical protein
MKKLDRKTSKLNLKAETIQHLTQPQLTQVVGGVGNSENANCVGRTQTCTCIDTVWC